LLQLFPSRSAEYDNNQHGCTLLWPGKRIAAGGQDKTVQVWSTGGELSEHYKTKQVDNQRIAIDINSSSNVEFYKGIIANSCQHLTQ